MDGDESSGAWAVSTLIGSGIFPKSYYRTTTEDSDAITSTHSAYSTSEFGIWSGARDLNPGPHGPEIYAVSSTDIDFEGFGFIWRTQPPVSSQFRPPSSLGLRHELLHRPGVNR
jgi:hypothetical protein